VFDGNSNYIFAEPIPSRTSHQIVKAYSKIHTLLLERGIRPTIHISDNETSDDFLHYLRSNHIDHQYVAVHQHRPNAAERAIRTFKNHFIAILCSCDPSFPLHLWDHLLEQATITLNLLRTSSLNNRSSAYSQIHGPFNFNATPIGPPGTRVIVHNKPSSRGTWAPHGEPAWYVGPAMEHYRNFTVYVPSTNAIRISDTLAWFPQHITMPTASSTDLAIAAAHDLTQALLHPSPPSFFAPLQNIQRDELLQLASIFGTVTSPTTTDTDPTTESPPIIHNEPRVVLGLEDTGEPRVAVGLEDTNDPRVSFETSRTSATSPIVVEPLSSPLTTNVPCLLTHTDLSYGKYNHNGPQRRRRARHNRRYRNPLPSSDI